jgi:hypothetical protein
MVEVRYKPVEYHRYGKRLVRRNQTTAMQCHHCKKELSGRHSPGHGSSIIWLTGRDGVRHPYHKCCVRYYLSSGPKGSGYSRVRRIYRRRR